MDLQVSDLENAISRIGEYGGYEECGDVTHGDGEHGGSCSRLKTSKTWKDGVFLMGHSSGAHISLLTMINRVVPNETKTPRSPYLKIDGFVGLSGPYTIDTHYNYELMRGVSEISPLESTSGYNEDRRTFEYSPGMKLCKAIDGLLDGGVEGSKFDDISLTERLSYLPKQITFCHGVNDETVPFTNSVITAKLLRECFAALYNRNHVDVGRVDDACGADGGSEAISKPKVSEFYFDEHTGDHQSTLLGMAFDGEIFDYLNREVFGFRGDTDAGLVAADIFGVGDGESLTMKAKL